MRQILLTAAVLLLALAAAPAPAATAEPAPTATPCAASLAAQPAPMSSAVGQPEPLFASNSTCSCIGPPLWCDCRIRCCLDEVACEAGCPPLGLPGRFTCLAGCRSDYQNCTAHC